MSFNEIKRIGFALSLLVGTSLTVMADGGQALIVTTKNSDKVVYALSEKPVVTFTETDVVLTTDKVQVSYPIADQVSFTFGDVATDINAIKLIEGLNAIISCDGKTVSVSQAAPGTSMNLYTLDGRQLKATVVDAAGQASLTMDTQGVYVVKVGKITVKIKN